MRHWSLVSVQRRFWDLVAAGRSTEDAAAMVGVSATCGLEWFRKFGGVNPRMQVAQGVRRPRLSLLERERIMIGTSRGESIRSIARGVGRAPSTVMREIAPMEVLRTVCPMVGTVRDDRQLDHLLRMPVARSLARVSA